MANFVVTMPGPSRGNRSAPEQDRHLDVLSEVCLRTGRDALTSLYVRRGRRSRSLCSRCVPLGEGAPRRVHQPLGWSDRRYWSRRSDVVSQMWL